jgi:hypothetical protein
MSYYQTKNASKTYKIICTRCFQSLGIASDPSSAKIMESNHVCSSTPEQPISTLLDTRSTLLAEYVPDSTSMLRQITETIGPPDSRYCVTTIFVTFILFYILPGLTELVALRYVNPWIALVLFGDAVGCFYIYRVLKMQKMAFVLYLVLTLGEAIFYSTHLVSSQLLLWLVNAIPAAFISMIVARIPTRGERESPLQDGSGSYGYTSYNARPSIQG